MQFSALTAMGLDVESLYLQEGVDLDEVHQVNARINVEPFNRVWYRGADILNDDTIGLAAVNFITPTTFHALGLAMWASQTPLEALQLFERYSELINNGGKTCFIQDNGLVALRLERFKNDDGVLLVTDVGLDCFFAYFIDFLRRHVRDDFAPYELRLVKKSTHHLDRYLKLFQCPVKFGARYDELVLTETMANEPTRSSDRTLLQINSLAAERYMDTLNRADIIYRLRVFIAGYKGEGLPTIEQCAQHLNTTVRTLQRMLSALGTQFIVEVESVRKYLAREYLQTTDLALAEIAYELGYQQANSFSRAFKTWYGITPLKFRHQQRRTN